MSCLAGVRFFFSSQRPHPALVPAQPPIQRVPGDISPGLKRQGHEADHSPPFNTEVENGGSIPPLRLHS
jgi:hypothetical protein